MSHDLGIAFAESAMIHLKSLVAVPMSQSRLIPEKKLQKDRVKEIIETNPETLTLGIRVSYKMFAPEDVSLATWGRAVKDMREVKNQ